MSSLLDLANRPGSEALVKDFAMLSEREERLKEHEKANEALEKWLKDGKAAIQFPARGRSR